MKKLLAILCYKLWGIKLRLLSLFSFKTLGVRALVIKDDQVLLVKHSYYKGWCTIGGGIEKGETPLRAIKRELLEEAGVTAIQEPMLMQVYYTNVNKREDYIIFYIIKDCSVQPAHSIEIAEVRWFKINNLPKDTNPATQRRIDEYLGRKLVSQRW